MDYENFLFLDRLKSLNGLDYIHPDVTSGQELRETITQITSRS